MGRPPTKTATISNLSLTAFLKFRILIIGNPSDFFSLFRWRCKVINRCEPYCVCLHLCWEVSRLGSGCVQLWVDNFVFRDVVRLPWRPWCSLSNWVSWTAVSPVIFVWCGIAYSWLRSTTTSRSVLVVCCLRLRVHFHIFPVQLKFLLLLLPCRHLKLLHLKSCGDNN